MVVDSCLRLAVSLDPPLPVYLFNIVAGLKEKSAKAYPIKKVLHMHLKETPLIAILAPLTSMEELASMLWRNARPCQSEASSARARWTQSRWSGRERRGCRSVTLRLIDLSSLNLNLEPFIKSSPFDIDAFRQETSVKYPTFAPPPLPSTAEVKVPIPAPVGKLAQAYSPIPIRHHYDHNITQDGGNVPGQMPFLPQQQQGSSFRQQPPSTPAPSPPPQPPQQQPGGKPKKQQYQTDQGRPFLFPFSRSENGKIPYAIDEADKLYNRHMHVSLALLQMWQTREDCMTVESGLEKMPGQEGNWAPSTYIRACGYLFTDLKVYSLVISRIWNLLKICLILLYSTPNLRKLKKWSTTQTGQHLTKGEHEKSKKI
jgi:hypothetical protein